MAVVQSTYATDIPVGYAGMVANGETSNRISRTVEDAAGIAFGKAAFRGAGDHGVTGTPSANFMGWAIADHGIQPLPGGVAADTYPQYASAGLMTLGCIWVVAGEAVTDGAAVYVTPAGAIVDTATDNTAITGWAFDGAAASGALVRIARR